MESAPLQRVTVAQCDHTTAGGRQTPFLTRRHLKASLEFKTPTQGIWKASESLKRLDVVCATSIGHPRPVRPYDSWRASDAISDPQTLESVPGVQVVCPCHSEGVGKLEEAGWSRRHSKGSPWPSAIIRQLEGRQTQFLTIRRWKAPR